MMRAAGAQRWTVRSAVAVVLVLAAVEGGCGDDEFANDRRPPASVTISAVITPQGITVSPSHFGAGTIQLLASNQTRRSQRLQVRSVRLAGGAQPLAQSTGPINPGGTAALTADVAAGTYIVSARSSSIEALTITVGAARAPGADQLLQP